MYEFGPIAQSQPAVLKSLPAGSALVPLSSTTSVLAVDRNRRTSDQCVSNSYAGYDQSVRMRQSLRHVDASARHFRHDSTASGAIETRLRAGEPLPAATRWEQFLQTEHAPDFNPQQSVGKLGRRGQGEMGDRGSPTCDRKDVGLSDACVSQSQI